MNIYTQNVGNMEIFEILNSIETTQGCSLIKREHTISIPNHNLPKDLDFYFSNYKSIKFFMDKPYGIEIVPYEEFQITNKVLYPEDDVIWEELAGDISEHWYMIARSEELDQYISIDTSEERKGYCYDSFLETHANPGSSMIIAKSFTELLKRLLESKGEYWFWLENDFKGYGDAYDD